METKKIAALLEVVISRMDASPTNYPEKAAWSDAIKQALLLVYKAGSK